MIQLTPLFDTSALNLGQLNLGQSSLGNIAINDMLFAQPGLMVAQVSKWLPVWLTPIWVIAAGLIVGAAVCLVIYGILAALSFVPGLGTLADSPKTGLIASLIVGAVVSVLLCMQYIPQQEEYAESLYMPLIAIV